MQSAKTAATCIHMGAVFKGITQICNELIKQHNLATRRTVGERWMILSSAVGHTVFYLPTVE